MAFFDTQRAQRFQAIRPQLPRLARFHQVFPHRQAVVRGHKDLKSQFARKSKAQYAQRHAF